MRWFLVIAVLLGTAFALRSGLIAFAGYVLLGVYALSRWLSCRWANDLRAERLCDTRPREVGESVEVSLLLTNGGILPVLWLLVEDLIPGALARSRPRRLSVKGRRTQVVMLGPRGRRRLRYTVTFLMRGYYPLGPTLLETGDVFGLHRRLRVVGRPTCVLVYPRVIPLAHGLFASRRPIGEVRLHDRLFEDPTRPAGVREYHVGDPLRRVHWKVTARTGRLHCRLYEPSSLAGVTVLLDCHKDGYPVAGEPYRSELAVTIAASIAHAVFLLDRPIGLAANGRDAAELIGDPSGPEPSDRPLRFVARDAARDSYELREPDDPLRLLSVPTRRGFDQFQRVRECLARVLPGDGPTFAEMVSEVAARMPRDATVVAVLPRLPVESALALGALRRQGFAVTVVLIGLGEDERLQAHGRLLAESVRDVYTVASEEELAGLGRPTSGPESAVYGVAVPLA